MNINPVTSFNNNQVTFTNKSRLFEPIEKVIDNHAEAIAKKYYTKFLTSKFAQKFVDKTKNVNNIATHMQVIGATLISGMYVVRTLNNDKLDKHRRKTLAINDGLTWALSTAGTYFVDSKLADWWNRVTTRFAANYLVKHPASKNKTLLGDWDPAKIYDVIENGANTALDKFEQIKKSGISKEEYARWMDASKMGKDIEKFVKNNVSAKDFTEFNEAVKNGANVVDMAKNKLSAEHFNEWINKTIEAGEKRFADLKTFVESGGKHNKILDLNLDILKDKKLSNCIHGMSFLKSLLIATTIYRYLVPVLVMKPANKIGAYIHKKNEEKLNTKA